MRVAQVLPAYFADGLDFMGGGDRYVYQLSKALLSYCDVTLYSFGPRPREERLDGLSHVVIPVRGGSNPDNPFPSALAFLNSRFDIVHSHQLRSTATALAALARRAQRKPLVVTDHGGGGRGLLYRLGIHHLIPSFICQSEFARGLLPAAARRRATVVRGGIDLTRFAYDGQPRSRQALQVGRIMPHKGMNDLLEAAGTDIPVVIAGKVVHRRFFRDLQEAARGKQVRFLVDVSDNAIHAEYVRAGVTVAASVYRDLYGGYWPTSELLGMTLLESMAVGTPVICTVVGGMPEFVHDGVTGFVVPPNDPRTLRDRMLQLLDDPAATMRMGAAGSQHVEQYSWDRVARQVSEEYARLLAGR